MDKLPVAFKKKWLKALRSGKYKQGEGQLERIDADGNAKYCCLGVACKMLYPKERIKGGIIELDQYEKVPNILKGTGSENHLVLDLATMNDGGEETDPESFGEIANWIEKNL